MADTDVVSTGYTVTIQVDVTASSHAEAAKLALDDLRDRSIGPWYCDVWPDTDPTQKKSVATDEFSDEKEGEG